MNRLSLIHYIALAESLLLLPYVAMFFTNEVDWTLSDFVIASVLLAGVGFALHMITTSVKNNNKLVFIGILLFSGIILLWAELAVGIFGSPIAGS